MGVRSAYRRGTGNSNWITELAKTGVLLHEFGLFVRSDAELDRARAAAKEAGVAFKVLDEHVEIASNQVSIGTMHLAKYNLIERCVNRLKQFRRIATRYEKTARAYLSMLCIAAAKLWIKTVNTA